MSTRSLLVASVLLLMASAALAHDLFLKLDTYFLEPHARARITVLNGTFAKSEGFVAPERIADISAVSGGGRTRLSAASTWSRGPDSTSVLSLALGDAGTYVVGVSTRPPRDRAPGRGVQRLPRRGRDPRHPRGATPQQRGCSGCAGALFQARQSSLSGRHASERGLQRGSRVSGGDRALGEPVRRRSRHAAPGALPG